MYTSQGNDCVKNDYCEFLINLTKCTVCQTTELLHMAQLMPLPLTVSCFSKIQIGFTFLVPADPGSPGQRAIKRVCVCNVLVTGVAVQVLGSTLILTWIPNSTLKKNPRSIENSPAAQTRVTPRRSPRQEYAHVDYPTSTTQSPTNSAVDDVSANCDRQQLEQSVSDVGSQGDICTVVENASEDCAMTENSCSSVNNIRPSCTPTNTGRARVGVNVNALRDKCTNILTSNTEQTATEKGDALADGSCHSVAVGAARQLAMLRSRSDSSNKSVASVEMEGDNLVVVTEEIVSDEAFVDTTENGAVNSSGSVLPEQYRETMDKLTAAASKAVGDDMQRVRRSLDLQLNLSQQNDVVEKVSDFDFEIAALNTCTENARKSSTSTSGPDSTPPSPSDIPDIPNLSSPEANNGSIGDTQQNDADFVKHYMSFPNNAIDFTAEKPLSDSSVTLQTAAEQVCGVFSVDLGIYASVFFISISVYCKTTVLC